MARFTVEFEETQVEGCPFRWLVLDDEVSVAAFYHLDDASAFAEAKNQEDQ